jgi:hypothetical protein
MLMDKQGLPRSMRTIQPTQNNQNAKIMLASDWPSSEKAGPPYTRPKGDLAGAPACLQVQLRSVLRLGIYNDHWFR